MSSVEEFVKNYTPEDSGQIRFAWNGKHSDDFVDENQAFRRSVVDYCLNTPDSAPTPLLEALFIAESLWAKEAWGSPNNYELLAETLLLKGGEEVIATFSTGLCQSFDTFGACHQIRLPEAVVDSLIQTTRLLLSSTQDKSQEHCLKSSLELFAKLKAGTAAAGWTKIQPGTPVSNIKVISPGRLQRFWIWLLTPFKKAR